MSYKQFSGEIHWSVGFSTEMFVPARNLGTMIMNETVGSPVFQMLLFRATAPGSTDNLRATVGWENLPEDRQRFSPNAKGTGLYMGSTARSVAVFADGLDGDIGVYLTPKLSRNQLLDNRDGEPGLVAYTKVFLRSTVGHLRSKTSPKDVVQNLDQSYGDARGVLLTPAPTVMAKERIRRGPFDKKPGWLLWRDPNAELIRVGTIAG